MTEVKIKQKKCKGCGSEFTVYQTTQKVCSIKCAITLHRDGERKKLAKLNRQRREDLKTRWEWLKEAQTEFNKYIRLRDHGEPCISCEKPHVAEKHLTGTGWDAGHYLSRGAHPELRFNEDNVHKQCVHCNRDLSGNHANFRKGLIKKIGEYRLAVLEGPHKPKKYTIEEIKEIKAKYRALWRELEKELAA